MLNDNSKKKLTFPKISLTSLSPIACLTLMFVLRKERHNSNSSSINEYAKEAQIKRLAKQTDKPNENQKWNNYILYNESARRKP